MDVQALKTGMLFDEATTRAVALTLKSKIYQDKAKFPPLVIDPVCVSTSGHTLLHPSALGTMFVELFPLATIITPNRQEAELILTKVTGHAVSIQTLEDMINASRELGSLGPNAVLLKGGHLVFSREDIKRFENSNTTAQIHGSALKKNLEVLEAARRNTSVKPTSDDYVVDVLFERENSRQSLFIRKRIVSTSTHGTGCTLSAALACALASDPSVLKAVQVATEYTSLAIETSPGLGKGNGPLNHLHSILPRSVPQSSDSRLFPFTEAMIQHSSLIWSQYVEHRFVTELGKGALPLQCFKKFIKQDYKYLQYYARAYGLLAAKATDYPTITSAAKVILHTARESEMHVAFCQTFGISSQELQQCPEDVATSAYGGYLLNIAIQGDLLKLFVAFMACLIGYGEVGLYLVSQAKDLNTKVYVQNNPYQRWIEDYSGVEYQQAVLDGINQLEGMIAQDPPSAHRFAELSAIWSMCTSFETNFWDMAMSEEHASQF